QAPDRNRDRGEFPRRPDPHRSLPRHARAEGLAIRSVFRWPAIAGRAGRRPTGLRATEHRRSCRPKPGGTVGARGLAPHSPPGEFPPVRPSPRTILTLLTAGVVAGCPVAGRRMTILYTNVVGA